MLRDVLPDVDPDAAYAVAAGANVLRARRRRRRAARDRPPGDALRPARPRRRARPGAAPPRRRPPLRPRPRARARARSSTWPSCSTTPPSAGASAPTARPPTAPTSTAPTTRPSRASASWTCPAARTGGTSRRPILEQAPDRVVTVRDARDALCGMAIAVTPDNAPPVCEQDVVLGPWLAHARATLARRGGPDLARLAGLRPARGPRVAGPVDPEHRGDPAVRAQEPAVVVHPDRSGQRSGGRVRAGGQHRARRGARPRASAARSTQCHVVDHAADGILGVDARRGLRRAGAGARADPDRRRRRSRSPRSRSTTTTRPRSGSPRPGAEAREPVTLEAVRDALRTMHQPLELAASPLARGTTTEERAASVRAEVEDAVANAFGDSPDEQLLRRIVQRGYLDPAGSHELAADELHVSPRDVLPPPAHRVAARGGVPDRQARLEAPAAAGLSGRPFGPVHSLATRLRPGGPGQGSR